MIYEEGSGNGILLLFERDEIQRVHNAKGAM